MNSVAEPHYLDAATAPGEKNYANLAPTPILWLLNRLLYLGFLSEKF
jgi:hypothetical protein